MSAGEQYAGGARIEAIEVVSPRPAAVVPPVRPGPRTSDTTSEVYAALSAAQLEYAALVKTRSARIESRGGAGYEYAYANLSDVDRAIMPALRKHQLLPLQIPAGDRLYLRLVHGPSGQWIEGVLPLALGPGGGSDVQRMGSAITYVRRYLLCTMLGIVALDDDDDGAAASRASGRAAPSPPPSGEKLDGSEAQRAAHFVAQIDAAPDKAALNATLAEIGKARFSTQYIEGLRACAKAALARLGAPTSSPAVAS